MKELVGTCSECQKEIFCLDGFFNGVQTADRKIYCFDCADTKTNENPQE